MYIHNFVIIKKQCIILIVYVNTNSEEEQEFSLVLIILLSDILKEIVIKHL